MTEKTHRRRMVIAGTAIATAILTSLAATPAQAHDADKAGPQSCWIQVEQGTTQCFADEAAMEAAMLKENGALPIEEGSAEARVAARSAVAAAGGYVIARLYEDASYLGSVLTATASTSTFCASGGVWSISSLSAAWNDEVSSVRSYWGCRTSLYPNSGFGGTPDVVSSAASLGAYNDVTSSYKVKA